MFLSLALALCVSITPLPKKCTVISVAENVVTVQQGGNAFAFKGENFRLNDNIMALFVDDAVIDVL